MKRLLSLLLSLLLVATTASAQLRASDYEWLGSVRSEHPRMFFTAEDVSQIVSNSMLFDAGTFNSMQRRIDRLITKGFEFKDELSRDNNSNTSYGHRTAESALLWLITKDAKYLDFAKMLLDKVICNYKLRVENKLHVGWQSFATISTLCAYDWMYNDLTAEERADLGGRLYSVAHDIAWHGKGVREKYQRENISGANSDFNGTSNLPWYVGLAFYGEGIDDEECVRMLRNGYDLHQKMSVARAKMLGKSGGINSGTIGNGFDNYPYAEYNFIYTFRSATGIDIAPQMSYMLGYLHYMDWARLPDNKEFGIGDSFHSNNNLSRSIVAHVKEISNLFAPTNPTMFNWFSSLHYRYNDKSNRSSSMQFLPLLHRYHFETDDAEYETADAKGKQSIHFEKLGQIVMRSGVDDKDTYAIFLTERSNKNRQHYDLNHFVIYKNGYRALDSGTRPQPGLHTPYYYCRTVAHNCVTIKMPNEKLPKGWGKASKNEDSGAPVPNDGGQKKNHGGKLLSYEESADYVYIASDATECYDSAKAEQVVREFVWIKPDIFVVFDRVASDKAEYSKSWLYHTASEPVMSGSSEFSEVSQGGKAICRTLLPKKAVVEFVGGEGKQFWSDGKNWAIPEYKADDSYSKRYRNIPRNNNPLVGQWRVEVSPKKASANDNFLHIIQVGDESLRALPQTECKEGKDVVSLSFDYAGKHYSLSFDKTKRYGCEIEVK